MMTDTTDAAARASHLELDEAPACGFSHAGRTCLRRAHKDAEHQDLAGTFTAPTATILGLTVWLSLARAAVLAYFRAVPAMAKNDGTCHHAATSFIAGTPIVALRSPSTGTWLGPVVAANIEAWCDLRLTVTGLAAAPAMAPVAAPATTVAPTTPTVIQYQLRPAGEAGGGFWVTRLNMGAMGSATGRVMQVPANDPNNHGGQWYVRGVQGTFHPSPLEAAAALTKAPLAAHEIAQGTTARPLIAGRGTRTLQQRAQRVVGAGVETEAQKAKREATERQQRAQAAIDGAITVALTAHDGEFPHGCLAAWMPLGTHTWQKIADVAKAADVIEPARRTDRAIASAAVSKLQQDGFRVEVQTRGSAWNVYQPAKVTAVGKSVGDTQLVVKLVDEQLVIEGPEEMAKTVRAAFDSAKATSQLDSTAISTWLASILKSWRAVSICYGRWIPPGARTEAWLRLANAMADAGLNVARRPAKVSSVEDVKEEVILGLKCEVESMISKIEGRIEAGKALKAGHIGYEGASALQLEVIDLRSKVKMYEVVTGPLAGAHAELDRMDAELAPFVTDAAARSALVAQEVG